MKFLSQRISLNIISLFLICGSLPGQNVIRGEVKDEATNEPLIGASILIKGTSEGTITDYDGRFELRTEQSFPVPLIISYIGYSEAEVTATENAFLEVALSESTITTEVVEVKGQRISETTAWGRSKVWT